MKTFLFCTMFIVSTISIYAQNIRWDNQFISTNAPDDTVFAITSPGNVIFAGGAFTNIGGTSANHIAMYDGTNWSALGSGINGNVYDIEYFNNYIIAGGDFTNAGGVATENLAIWDGSAWATISTSCNGTIRALGVFDQYLYVGGDFTSIGGIAANHIARFDGTNWQALGTGTDGPVYCIHITNFLYVGGNFLNAGGSSANYFAQWNWTSWQPFGSGFDAPVYSIEGSGIQVVAGGSFTQSGTTVLNHTAKWDGTEWLPLDLGTNGIVRDICRISSDFYFCGNFTTAGSTNTNNIAKWNGSVWSDLGDGINQEGFCLSKYGYDLLAGGDFTMAGANPSNYFGRYISPPVITSQSGVTTICEGDSLILIVNAQSHLPVNYQWEKDSSPILVDNDSLIIYPVQFSDGGNYSCTVNNAVGSNTSSTILVNIYQAPLFDVTITDTSTCDGVPVILAATGTGTNPIGYQWYFDSAVIPGQINDSLTLSTPSTSNTGNYLCIASNMCGVDTNFFTLTVNSNPVVNFSGLATEYCVNDSADIITGTPFGGIFSGNGVSDSLFSPSGLVGNHTITYTFTDNNGCIGTSSQSTLVNTLTFVTFSGIETNYCFNSLNDTLHGLPSGGIYYGSGMTDSIFSPNSVNPGNQTVYYAYTDLNGCTNTKSLSTYIFFPQTFSYTGLDTALCENDNLFTINVNPAGGVFSGTGITGNDFDPQTAGLGIHTILYEYTDGNNCFNTDSLHFSISSLPIVSISSILTDYCNNDAPYMIDASPAGGTFSGTNFTNAYLDPSLFSPGTYEVYYTYADSNGCSGADTASFNILTTTTVILSGLSTYYCANAIPDTLYGNPTGGVFSGNGVSGNIFSPALAGSGTNPVVYTYDNLNGCFSFDSVLVTVEALPALDLGPDVNICLGDTITLTAVGDSGTILWSTFDTTSFITVSPSSSTEYYALLYAGNCHNSDTVHVSVNPMPVVDLGPDFSACPPAELSVSNNYATYLWSTGSTDTLISITTTGLYSITVTNSFGCSKTDEVNATLLAAPQIDLGPDNTISGIQTLILGTSPNYSNYLWNTGSTQNFIVIQGSSLGEGYYPFWLTVSNSIGCSATDTIIIQVLGDVSVDENNITENFSIYPNPATDLIQLRSNQLSPEYSVSLISMSGKVILEANYNDLERNNNLLSLKGIPKGTYIVKVLNGELVYVQKLIVQ